MIVGKMPGKGHEQRVRLSGQRPPDAAGRHRQKHRRALLRRALLIWLGLVVAAFVNGALREILLAPALGEDLAAPLSALLFALIIGLAAWWLARSFPPQPARAWLAAGALWAALTMAFELGFFGLAMGVPLPELIANLDPRRGGWFGLVLLVALLAPMAFGALRNRSPV